MAPREKIYITGTGRSGTTFLIKLFTFLGFDTGYTEDTYDKFIFKNCNSGMERHYSAHRYVIKNPTIIVDIEAIVADPNIKIKYIIIPIRDYKDSAQSRARHGVMTSGGLWHAQTVSEQMLFYHTIMANYLYSMTAHDLPTIFLSFDKMISDKQYLFNALKVILDEKNINFDRFSKIYDIVSVHSRPS
jgi:hypothetical protein